MDQSKLLGRNHLTPVNLCGAIDLSHLWELTSACYAEGAVGALGVMRSVETHVRFLFSSVEHTYVSLCEATT
jgi:hypothetical protein